MSLKKSPRGMTETLRKKIKTFGGYFLLEVIFLGVGWIAGDVLIKVSDVGALWVKGILTGLTSVVLAGWHYQERKQDGSYGGRGYSLM